MSTYSTNILSAGFVGQATKGKRASLLMDVVILVLFIDYTVYIMCNFI